MRGTDIIAHRGASFEAPENTLAAFRRAWEEKADGIEGDFRLTRDGEIVCIHDPTTGRTAGVDLTVAAATLAELSHLDVGAWKGEKWRGERIPTLREVLATMPPEKKLFIEIKSGPEILPPLAAILAEDPSARKRVKILAFDEEVVTAAASLLPNVKRLLLTDFARKWRGAGLLPSAGEILAALERTEADGLAGKARRAIDADFVNALREAGKEFHVWTVDAPRTAARFIALGADSVITNRPQWLRTRLPAIRPEIP